MPDLSYWERRQVEDAFETFTEAEAIADQISTLYFNASRQLSREARGIFDRFRRKYGLSEEEARRLLGRLQDPTSLEQLRRMLRNTQQTDEIVALRREIESAAFRARLDRLQAMQNNLDLIMRQIYKRELKINTDFYTNLADKSYYRCMYRMQQRANAAFGFSHISQKVIDDVVSSRWSGKNFSARIWGNTTALANTLKEEMLVGLVTGRTLRDTAGVIAEKCSQSANNARRLVRTESNYIHTQMNFKAYEEADVEKYLYLATLDLRTSKICRSLDGEIFPVKDQKIGVNCPPMHPWCRSTTIAILDEDLLKTMQRSAIDPVTGKRIKVPATMKYHEWYDKYVVGHDDEISSRQLPERNVDRQQFERYRERGIGPETYEEFRNVKYGETERYEQMKRDFRDTKQFENYKDILGDDAPATLEEFQQIKYNNSDLWKYLRLAYNRRRRLVEHPELELPGLDNIVVDPRKFTGYFFNPENARGWAKGQAYITRLGYSLDNYDLLRDEIIRAAKLFPTRYIGESEFGRKYEQRVVLYGLKGTPANVEVGWMLRSDGSVTMTTAYINEVKKGEH